MDIKRFDEIEFQVLDCAKNGGYYPEGENAARAKVLMSEGIFEFNPEDNWWKTGWKLTDIGQEYYKEFMQKVQQKHGHVWEKNDYNDNVNIFAYSNGYHNGPKCINCGYEFCQHCKCEINIPVCTEIE